jgi:hypothetical protein
MLHPVGMRTGLCTALALTLALGACGYGSEAGPGGSSGASPQPSPSFNVASAVLRGDEGSVLVEVEVAQSPEQRSRGLMFRDSLEEDSGMVFLFFERTEGGFWMKNTKMPLSIATAPSSTSSTWTPAAQSLAPSTRRTSPISAPSR